MKQRPIHAAAILVPALLIVAATPALADRIDGDWCLGTKHFSIDGETIKTPAGNSVSGIYSRHAYAYSIPPGEPNAGKTVRMRLMNEKQVDVLPTPDAVDEVWERCEPVS